MSRNKTLSVLEQPNPTYGVLQQRYSASIGCKCGYQGKIGGVEKENQLRKILREIRREHRGPDHQYSIETSCHASELTHASTTQTTRQTTTSTTYSDVTGASIGSSNFTAGKKYLLIFTAVADSSTDTNSLFVRAVHGSSTFGTSRSEMSHEVDGATPANNKVQYTWFHVWTAASGEAVKLQFKTETMTSTTVGIDHIAMSAIKLSDDFIENVDWFFNENETNTSITGSDSSTNNAIVSITPRASSDWLVMSCARIAPASTSVRYTTKLVSTGTTASSEPQVTQEGESTSNDQFLYCNIRAFALTAVANTFEEKVVNDAGASSGTRSYSAIFALNLNRLRNHSFAHTEAEFTPTSTTNYVDQIQTISITPAIQGDVMVIGSYIYDAAAGTNNTKGRIQVDNNDLISDVTSDAYIQEYAWDALDELPVQYAAIVNMSASSHTIDLDASSSTTTGARFEDRCLVAFTMELRSGVVNISPDGTENYTTLSSALNAEGGNTKYILAPGLYSEYDIEASYNNITIEGSGPGLTILEIPAAQTGTQQLLKALGTGATVGQSLTADATKGDREISMTSGDELNYSANDDILITDNFEVDTDRKGGEWHRVLSTSAGEITLDSPARFTYDTTPEVFKLNMLKNITLRNLTLRSAQTASTLNDGSAQVQFKFVRNLVVDNCIFENLRVAELQLFNCAYATISNCRFYKPQLNTGADPVSRYCVSIRGATTNLVVSNCTFEDARHGFTYGAGDSDASAGRGENILVVNCQAVKSDVAHFDVHRAGGNVIMFVNCQATGIDSNTPAALVSGFSLRTPATLIGCTIQSTTRGITLTTPSGNSQGASGSIIRDCNFYNIIDTASSGAGIWYEDNVENITIDGCHFENIAGGAVEGASSETNGDHFVIQNCRMLNTNNSTEFGSGASIEVDGDDWLIEGNYIQDNTHESGKPIVVNSASTNIAIRNNKFLDNEFDAPTVNSDDNNIIIEDNEGYNPIGKITNPLNTTDGTIGLYNGTTSTASASTDYTVVGSDLTLSSTGGTGVSITIKQGANTIASGLSTITAQFLRRGWIINFGAFSAAPTLTVIAH